MKFQFTSSGIYDKLKWLAQIGLPTLGGAYFAVAQIWGLPAAEEVVGTISVVDAALGGLLGLSSKNYVPPADGKLLLNPDELPGANKFTFSIQKDLDEVKPGDKLTFTAAPHPVTQAPVPPSPHPM